MATGWVSEAWPLGGSLDGFLRHGRWVGFRVMAAGWVTGWVSEAWPQGHWMGFSGMATGLVLEAWLLGPIMIMEHFLHPCGVKDAKNSNYCITPT